MTGATMKTSLGKLAREPMTWILAPFVVALVVGWWWNLPCTDGWANDEVAPRTSMLAAAFETYIPGHFFRYPPLHLLILFVLQLPILVVAGERAGFESDAIAHEAIKPAYMTVAMVIARFVSSAMAVGLVILTKRLWERLGGTRVGLLAAAVVALNPLLLYHARTTRIDLPYWFWMTWSLFELDRVACGEPRERQAWLLAAAAILTKDTAMFVLLGPIVVTLALIPASAAPRGERLRAVFHRRGVQAALLTAGVYAIVCGAAINPTGFKRRMAHFNDMHVGWTIYENSLRGVFEQLRDIALAFPLFGSVLVWALAVAGVVIALRGCPRVLLLRRAVPLVAALTYFALFLVPSRWAMDRYVMPLALLLLPYSAFAFDRMLGSPAEDGVARDAPDKWLSRGAWALAAWVIVGAVYDAACVDGTLVADSRNRATAFLSALPPGTPVEVYGGTQYMPHLPMHLDLVRVDHDPVGDRREIPGVREVVARYGDIERRRPAYVVVSETVARAFRPLPGVALSDRDRAAAEDPDAHPFFAALDDESLPYHRVLTARCELPSPFRCRRIDLSTGAETWIYQRR
jgi:hypothetical protein